MRAERARACAATSRHDLADRNDRRVGGEDRVGRRGALDVGENVAA